VEEICGVTAPAAEDFAEPSSSQLACVNSQEESLKDSLGAVRKSTQAAARIFQAFRVESFHRKKVIEYGDDDCGLSDERTLSLISLRNPKPGHGDLHSAAVRIQNKFRGWKGRKEFMIIRQKIVKIQVISICYSTFLALKSHITLWDLGYIGTLFTIFDIVNLRNNCF
jgi:hypothetical protein